MALWISVGHAHYDLIYQAQFLSYNYIDFNHKGNVLSVMKIKWDLIQLIDCFISKALDRGAALLKVDKVATGHNADDIAETVLLNILRGDIAR